MSLQCQQVLDWSDVTWPAGSTMQTFTNSAGDVFTFTVTDPSNSLETLIAGPLGPIQTPFTDPPFYQGDQATPVSTLLTAVDLETFYPGQTLTINGQLAQNISEGVNNVNFKLFDVDGEDGSNPLFDRKEQYEIIGYLDGVPVYPSLTINPTVHELMGANNNIVQGNRVPVAPNDFSSAGLLSDNGVVSVSFSSPIDAIDIIFSIPQSVQPQPNSRPGFGIFDINYDYITPPNAGGSICNVFDWSDVGNSWVPGTTEGSYFTDEMQRFTFTVQESSAGILDVFNTFGATGNVQTPFVSPPFFQGDQVTPVNTLLVSASLSNIHPDEEIRIIADLGGKECLTYEEVSFKIFDVDGQAAGSPAYRQEQVEIIGYLNGVAVLPTLTGNPAIHQITGNTAIGLQPSNPNDFAGNPANADSDAGTVTVTFPSSINRFEIIFTVPNAGNPSSGYNMSIGLYDIDYCVLSAGINCARFPWSGR